MSLLNLDLTGSIDADFGVTQDQLRRCAPQMDRLREDFLVEVGRNDNHFFDLPMQQYQAYQDRREASPLGHVFDVGTSLHDHIDAVVVIGSASATLPTQGIFRSCCDPYHNELSRADRGSRPRMYFTGQSFDNDDLAALLHRLRQHDFRDSPAESRWAMVVIDPSCDPSQLAYEVLVCELGEPQRFVFPIVESGSWLDRQAQALGCERWFSLPPDAALPEQALSMSSLLPAAMLGLDCIKLLEGAVMINEHFKSTPAGENVVLQWVAIHRLLAQHRGITRRSIRPWASALDWLPSWYQSIRGGDDLSLSAKSITVNVVAKQPRYDPVAIANHAGDGHSGSLVGRMVQTMESANLAARDAGNPTVTLNLPTVDTRVLGQIFQMLLIATRIDTPALPCSA